VSDPGPYVAARPAPAPDVIDQRLIERRRQATRRRRHRAFAAVVLGVLAGLVGVGGYSLAHSSWLSARHITVIGNSHETAGQVVAASGLSPSSPLIDVSSRRTAAAIVHRLAWVKSAVVSRHWPDSVVIRVVDCSAVAAVQSGSATDLVSSSGRVLTRSAAPPHVPVVSISGALPGVGDFVAPLIEAAVSAAVKMPASLAGMAMRTEVLNDGHLAVVLRPGVVADLGSPIDLAEKLSSLGVFVSQVGLANVASIDVSVPSHVVVTPRTPQGA
jgi:cell division protein FtsQ